jgi:hypothetical protein
LNIECPTSNAEWEKMKKQTYDLEERLLEYSVRIIKIVEQLPNDSLGRTTVPCMRMPGPAYRQAGILIAAIGIHAPDPGEAFLQVSAFQIVMYYIVHYGTDLSRRPAGRSRTL